MSSRADSHSAQHNEGICSLLDTDLYKLTMQCCVLKYFPEVEVTYNYTNRTSHMKFNRKSYTWLCSQIQKLGELAVSAEELHYLKTKCGYFSKDYLEFLKGFRLRPSEHVRTSFHPENDSSPDCDAGTVELVVKGSWIDTILYEIPLLALLSEAYSKFTDTEWNYDSQTEIARKKGQRLLEHGCYFSEFGTRRRRDYHTQELVLQGLMQAKEESTANSLPGELAGTSNVHFALKFGLTPIGTVAHEWFMGIAAINDDYQAANEVGLRYWIETFGVGVLGIALTDTFGTPAFLHAFGKPIPFAPSTASEERSTHNTTSYALVFNGVRQDSGDPENFVKLMRDFYDREGIHEKKDIVFSDSLDIELCLKYKDIAESFGFNPRFGIGTFLTNDFASLSTGQKSTPLNIVIKLASAAGRPAVKISDSLGKNTGDGATVKRVKDILGYQESEKTG